MECSARTLASAPLFPSLAPPLGATKATILCPKLHEQVHKVKQVAPKLRAADPHTRRGVFGRGEHLLFGGV